MLTAATRARRRAALPFAVLGGAAIIAGGLVAAAVARRPVGELVWMSAYLVLIVGVAQCTFGMGQALLAQDVPTPAMVWSQWAVFNLGNVGVIAGTLLGSFAVVAAGTVLFAIALALFLTASRGSWRARWLVAYRLLLLLMLVSSLVGLGLSAAANLR